MYRAALLLNLVKSLLLILMKNDGAFADTFEIPTHQCNQQLLPAANTAHGVSLMQKMTERKAVARDDAGDGDDGGGIEAEEADAYYVLTWEVPAALRAESGVSVLEAQHRLEAHQRWINVTALEARQMTGPLTLLLALRMCEGAKALKSGLEEARKRGQARIHLLGVQDEIEPQMAWKRFLVGPLTDRDQLLVDTFGLERTPLAGVKVSLLFNGNELFSHTPRHKGMFSEAQSSGLYHKKVKEIPDLAIMLNPGFPHYLGNWWPTLRRLWHAQVPIVATGYGHSFGNGFALPAVYNLGYGAEGANVLPGVAAGHLKTASPPSSTKPASSQQSPVLFADEKLKTSNFTCVDSKDFMRLPEKATDCSDRDGNALVVKEAGFEELFAVRNPFVFCSPFSMYETSANCQGSEVLSVLQPKASGKHTLLALEFNGSLNAGADHQEDKGKEENIPGTLAKQIMHRSLTCTPYFNEHRVCMERRLQRLSHKKLSRKARAWVDEFLQKIADECEDELYRE